MRESLWPKMLILSLILHLSILSLLSIKIKRPIRKIELLPSFSVNIVDSIGQIGEREGKEKGEAFEEKGSKKNEKGPIQKPFSLKKKIEPQKKEKAFSLSSKVGKDVEKEDWEYLEKRLREIRQRVTVDIGSKGESPSSEKASTSKALTGTGSSGSGSVNPDLNAYLMQIWNIVRKAWKSPSLGVEERNLETIVSVRIRKDGRITSIEIEKRSGNRIYDESVLRLLRKVDPFPPFPASLNMEEMEIGFRFLPGEIS